MRSTINSLPRPRSPYGLVVLLGLVPAALTAWIMWFAPVDGLTADRSALAGRDYTALWAAGRLAAARAFDVLADPAAYTDYLRALFGPGMPDQIWPYPPPMLLLARLCAAVDLGPGMLLYTAASLLALGAALAAAGLRPAAVGAVLLSPAVATNALAGQNGALIASVLVGGLTLMQRRPARAGLWLGCLCLKPQFALLLPICLLARRNRSTAAWGCIMAVALALASLLAFGAGPWSAFVQRDGAAVGNYVGASWQATASQTLFSSVLMAARSLGASLTLASALQAGVAAACAVVAWRLWSAPASPARIPATLALTLLASPWVHLYDMPALAAAIVMLLPHVRRRSRIVLGLAWMWPGLAMLMPVTPCLSVLLVASVAAIACRPPPSHC